MLPEMKSSQVDDDSDVGTEEETDERSDEVEQSDTKSDEQKDWKEIAAELKQQLSELQDKYQRLGAEFDNFRKRQEKVLAEMIEQERDNVIGRLLEIADDVARAIESANKDFQPQQILDGIKLISQRISELLRLEGVVAHNPKGEKFDPFEQDAVGVVPVSTPDEDGRVVRVLHPTYKRGNRLVRPAKVFVGKFEQKNEKNSSLS